MTMKLKARRKGTDNHFEEVDVIQLKNSYVLQRVEDVEFEYDIPTNGTNIQTNEELHWQDVRERAAIAALQGVMGFFGSIDYNRETIAKLAVEQADAFIEQLKKHKQ